MTSLRGHVKDHARGKEFNFSVLPSIFFGGKGVILAAKETVICKLLR